MLQRISGKGHQADEAAFKLDSDPESEEEEEEQEDEQEDDQEGKSTI